MIEIIPIAEANVETLMQSINRVIINPLIVLLFALAIVYFLYGLLQFFLKPDNEEVKAKSKEHMLWGIIGMFVMVAVWGVLNIILNTLGGENKIKIINGNSYTIKK